MSNVCCNAVFRLHRKCFQLVFERNATQKRDQFALLVIWKRIYALKIIWYDVTFLSAIYCCFVHLHVQIKIICANKNNDVQKEMIATEKHEENTARKESQKIFIHRINMHSTMVLWFIISHAFFPFCSHATRKKWRLKLSSVRNHFF